MLEKIEVGMEYVDSCNETVIVDYSDIVIVYFIKYGPSAGLKCYVEKEYAKKHWSEIPIEKKRYWLWDVNGNHCIFKTSIYLDESGKSTNGDTVHEGSILLKKHENEFVEV